MGSSHSNIIYQNISAPTVVANTPFNQSTIKSLKTGNILEQGHSEGADRFLSTEMGCSHSNTISQTELVPPDTGKGVVRERSP